MQDISQSLSPLARTPSNAGPLDQDYQNQVGLSAGHREESPEQAQVEAKSRFAEFQRKQQLGSLEENLKDQILYITTNLQRNPSYPLDKIVVPQDWKVGETLVRKAGESIDWHEAAALLTGNSAYRSCAPEKAIVLLQKDWNTREYSVGTALQQLRGVARAVAMNPQNAFPRASITLNENLYVGGKTYSKGQSVDWLELARALGVPQEAILVDTSKKISPFTDAIRAASLPNLPEWRTEAINTAHNILDYISSNPALQKSSSAFEAVASKDCTKDMEEMCSLATKVQKELEGVKSALATLDDWSKLVNPFNDALILKENLVIDGKLIGRANETITVKDLGKAFGLPDSITSLKVYEQTYEHGILPILKFTLRDNILDFLKTNPLKADSFVNSADNQRLADLMRKWDGYQGTVYSDILLGLKGGLILNKNGQLEVSPGSAATAQKKLDEFRKKANDLSARQEALTDIIATLRSPNEKALNQDDKDGNYDGRGKPQVTVKKEFISLSNGQLIKAGQTFNGADLYRHATGKELPTGAKEKAEEGLTKCTTLIQQAQQQISTEYNTNTQFLQNAISNFQMWISVMQSIIASVGERMKEPLHGMKI